MNSIERESVPYLPLLENASRAAKPSMSQPVSHGLRHRIEVTSKIDYSPSAANRFLELWRVCYSRPSPEGKMDPVLADFSLCVRQGEFLTLMGPTDCAQTDILSLVAGLIKHSSGGIVLAGREIDGPGLDRGMVFSTPTLLPWLTVFENVVLGVGQANPVLTRQQKAEVVIHYLELVGMGDFLGKRPSELSEGMKHRVGLARAFALNPKLILLDNPFGTLGLETRNELQQVLADLLLTDRRTTLMVTHDVDEALLLSDRIVMMTRDPNSSIGEIMSLPFGRPRVRTRVEEHPDYDAFREHLIRFLKPGVDSSDNSDETNTKDHFPGSSSDSTIGGPFRSMRSDRPELSPTVALSIL